jgi:hypothetical protein
MKVSKRDKLFAVVLLLALAVLAFNRPAAAVPQSSVTGNATNPPDLGNISIVVTLQDALGNLFRQNSTLGAPASPTTAGIADYAVWIVLAVILLVVFLSPSKKKP